MPRAVVLLSGGLDSTTCLAVAKHEGYDLYALSFNYGQRHNLELRAASNVAKVYKCEHVIVDLNLGQFKHSALTDTDLAVPEFIAERKDIPITYVPARNLSFLAIAVGYAESLEARDIFIGVNQLDYSGYPDCRPEFIEAFQTTANLATKQGVSGKGFRIKTPLINLTKAEIITLGLSLGVDYSNTVSCYSLDEVGVACGKCDACCLRLKGFATVGLKDPICYK